MLCIRIAALALCPGLTACTGTSPPQGSTGTTSGSGTTGTTGGAKSLQGLLAFEPDAVFVTVESLPDGGVDTSTTTIDFTRSSPQFTCAEQRGSPAGPVLFYDI